MTDLATKPPRPRQSMRLRTGATELRICPWPEAPDSGDRFPMRHPYVEAFYSSTLGPTAILLVRRFALALAVNPEGCTIGVDYLAGALGLGAGRGRNSPLVRSLERVVWHRLALWVDDNTLAVRAGVPRLPAYVVERLPVQLQAEHAHALVTWERPQ